MRSSFAITLFFTLAFASCSGSNTNNNAPNTNGNSNESVSSLPTTPIKPESASDPSFKPCNAYMPLAPGSQMIYSLNYPSGLVADQRIVVDEKVEEGKKVFVERSQIIDRSGGFEKNELEERRYVCDGERVRLVSNNIQNVIQGKMTRSEWKFRGDAVAMIEPSNLARKGSKWSYSLNQVLYPEGQPPINMEEPVFVNFEAQGEEEVSTPAGKFRAIKVVRRVGKNEIIEHFVRGIGLVRREGKDGTSLLLREYGGLKPANE